MMAFRRIEYTSDDPFEAVDFYAARHDAVAGNGDLSCFF